MRVGRRYGAAASQLADLWIPDGATRDAAIVLLHGGYWRARYGRDQMDDVADDLAGRGWMTCNLEYRRTAGDEGGWPATFDDVRAGVAALGDRPVVTIGHSAGGQLALWAAAVCPQVVAAVGQAPVSDMAASAHAGHSDGAAALLLGGPPGELPDRYAESSPIERLPLGVPQLVVHGDRDEDVPVAMSREYAQAATAAGDLVDYVELEATGHMEHLDAQSRAWRTVVEWLAAEPWA